MSSSAKRIIHSVIFSLKHPQGSEFERIFLDDGRRILTSIPVVNDFRVFRQTSPKNDLDFGFSMVFNSQADYETYNDHPAHVAFVNERWLVEVEKFLEIDYEQI